MAVKKAVVAPKPIAIKSPLTGAVVTAEQAKFPVTGVMVENSQEARPQSGLNEAGVVFEAVAEGGITRFLALYQETSPGSVGPIRSARPYYIDWLLGFDATYAHVGGSPDALGAIKSQGVKDMDQFANSGSYQRVKNRTAPHNVYTSLEELRALAQRKGFASSSFTSWPRKAEAKLKQPTAGTIDFAISSALYNANYVYDPASNTYKRSEGGKPHFQIDSGGAQTQLAPKVVVGLVMSKGLAADRSHTTYGTIGSGQAYVFQDGGVTPATWRKADAKSQITLEDSAGKPIALNAGQTWVTVVGVPTAVTYKP